MAIKFLESTDDKEGILEIKMSDMKNGQIGVDEYGNAIIHISHGDNVVNLILDDDSNANSYSGKCESRVTILPKGKSVIIEFYNE